jgi:hypothetical protein
LWVGNPPFGYCRKIIDVLILTVKVIIVGVENSERHVMSFLAGTAIG